MHDLHEADKILKLVLEYAAKNKLSKVTRIALKLGEVMEHGEVINPENLKFNIEMLGRGSAAEGVKVEIRKAEIKTWQLVEIEGE
jgi:Zn finger protein HypA/HybF involved in hydrogenase expression